MLIQQWGHLFTKIENRNGLVQILTLDLTNGRVNMPPLEKPAGDLGQICQQPRQPDCHPTAELLATSCGQLHKTGSGNQQPLPRGINTTK